MAKKNSKRREWTKTDIRELKTLARGKTPAGKIAQGTQEDRGSNSSEGFCPGSVLGFSCLERQFDNYSINRPATSAGLTF